MEANCHCPLNDSRIAVGAFSSLWNAETSILSSVKEEGGLLLVSDDALVPVWFMDEFEAARLPNEAMTFFFFFGIGNKWRELYDKGYSYVRGRYLCGQINYYPQWLCSLYADWTKLVTPVVLRNGAKSPQAANLHPDPKYHYRNWNSDDGSMKACLTWAGKDIYMTLPHLCDHLRGESTLGHHGSKDWVSRAFGKSLLRKWDKQAVIDYTPPDIAKRYLT